MTSEYYVRAPYCSTYANRTVLIKEACSLRWRGLVYTLKHSIRRPSLTRNFKVGKESFDGKLYKQAFDSVTAYTRVAMILLCVYHINDCPPGVRPTTAAS